MPLSSTYDPKKYEAKIYDLWQESSLGSPEKQEEAQKLKTVDTHAILMPPPNLTGVMHAGHSFQHFLMDTISRINRQEGKSNLWYPGVDHAGIQLEGVIDKLIKKGEFDEVIKQKVKDLPEKKQSWPQYLKTNYVELWFELAWQKVNLWRDNQKKQARILGDTPDYSRELFTLDTRASEMVNFAFEKYYKDGLIYKGAYIVNWSVGLQTALSDVTGEIEYSTRTDPFVTFEYQPKEYQFADNAKLDTPENKEFLLEYLKPISKWPRLRLSTVRPETKFTDLAVAMHPTKFDTYFNFDLFEATKKGFDKQKAESFIKAIKDEDIVVYYDLPPLKSAPVKLVFVEEVEANFGTGIVKITPGHDMFDYKVYKKLEAQGKLPSNAIQTSITRQGKLNDQYCGQFSGLTVEQGRLATIKHLAQAGFIPVKEEFISEAPAILAQVKTNLESEAFKPEDLSYQEGVKVLRERIGDKLQIDWDYEHNVALCERSKTVIEPLISEEFFLDYKKDFFDQEGEKTNLQSLGREGVKETEFFSSDYKDRALQFIENINNWCISRDLVWGHSIPVWYNLDTNPDRTFYNYTELQNKPELKEEFAVGSEEPKLSGNWVKEEKILDTWFSSCLWPLTTFDYLSSKQKRSDVVIIHGGEAFDDYQSYLSFLQSWEVEIDEGEKISWKKNLEKNLRGKNYRVITPTFPNAMNAKYEEWKIWLEKYLQKLDKKDLTLVGHSLGANFLLKYLSENKLAVKQLVLIAGCTDAYSFEVQSWQQISQNCEFIDVFHSLDDPVVPYSEAEKIIQGVPKSKLHTYKDKQHFGRDQKNFTEVEQVILQNLEFKPTDFQKYYPTQEMTTAKEIFYLWIVRMIILGKYFANKIPFEKVIITPTILDDQGRKMSKSLGNGLDPVKAIQRYSSDALRLAMLGGMIPNRNMKMGGKLADTLMEKYRNFGNKVWNVARFLENLEEDSTPTKQDLI